MKKAPLFALTLVAASLSAQEETQDSLPPEPATLQQEDAMVEDTMEEEAVEQGPPAPQLDQVVPVADDPGEDDAADVTVDDSAPVTGPTFATEADELVYQYERYIGLMQEGVYDEADSVAKRVVELAISVQGPNSTDFAKALTNLAIVQHRTEQFDAAQQNFESAIEIIENNEDQLDEQLVNPLRGLGAAQLEAGRPDKAIQSFTRAVHVTHVNAGPHNLDQISILESMSESQLRVGNIDEAKHIQDRIYALNERAYADNALAMVPALMRRAEWQHRAGFINDQRTTLRRAIRILETSLGKDDMALVEPLTKLGQSYFYIDLSGTSNSIGTLATGETHFKRALRIASEDPNASWTMIADTSLALGDYYNFLDNAQQAHNVYHATWEDLSDGDEKLAYRRENMEQWVTLRENPFPQFVNTPSTTQLASDDDALSKGSITISYDVSERGRAENLSVIEAEPREFVSLHRRVQRQLRRRIYRPRYADGEPVATEDQVIVHTFYYSQADLEEARGNASGTGAP